MHKGPESQSTVVRTSRGLSIAGTRTTLYHVMDYVKAGRSLDEIRDGFNLTDQQITDVMAYIDEHRAAVEAEYQQVLQEAEEIRQYWEERNRERMAEIASLPPRSEQAAVRAKLAAEKRRLGLK
jgi:uncharacterized protein (DUF433 family)